MSYAVKEIHYTLQGEGAQVGRPAVLCRFTGCNLWTGREEDRARAVCPICDTNFVGTDGPNGGHFASHDTLADAIAGLWRPGIAANARPFAFFTGGEPLLQLDVKLVDALHARGFEIAVETNGTLPAPPGIDWLTVSPKANTELAIRSGSELKLVFPQAGAEPERYVGLDFRHFFLQPLDGPERERNTRLAVAYCLDHPQWRLSLQTHKYLGIP